MAPPLHALFPEDFCSLLTRAGRRIFLLAVPLDEAGGAILLLCAPISSHP
jgi:hypothetical protein